MGSVKDLKIIEPPQEDKTGIGRFIFSDRYSVFDWGEMPGLIEDKGKALALISAYFFEKTIKAGIKTHYLGLIDKNGKRKSLNDLTSPTNVMEVKLVRVIKPVFDPERGEYDYSIFKKLRNNFLIPAEFIYRNYIVEGSSFLNRLREGKITPEDYEITGEVRVNEKLHPPIIEVSTKLEEADRYISWNEFQEMSGLSNKEVNEVKDLIKGLNQKITDRVSELGIKNIDGKFEFAFDEVRDIMVVDVFGTPDECRFQYDGINLSKEILRKYYRKTEWYRDVKNAKEEAKKKNIQNWRELVQTEPPVLPQDLKDGVSMIYKSLCNELTGIEFFDVPPFHEVIEKLSSLMSSYNILDLH